MSVSLPYLLPGWWGKWDSASQLWPLGLPASTVSCNLYSAHAATLHNKNVPLSVLCLSLCLGLGKVPDWGSYFSTVGDSTTQSPFPEVSCSLTEP